MARPGTRIEYETASLCKEFPAGNTLKVMSYTNNEHSAAKLVLVHTPNFDLDSEVIVAGS